MVSFINVDFVIAPFGFHRQILLQRQGKFDQSFQLLTKEQFLQETSFTVDEAKAYEVLLTHEQLPPSFASLYLSYLTFVPPKHSDRKVQQLHRYFDLLLEHKAITLSPFARTKFSNKNVVVIGYLQEDTLLNERFNSFSMQVNYDKPPFVPEGMVVERLETISDEVSLFFNRVLSLYEQGVPSHKIVLIQPPSEYRYELERQASYFNVPLALPSQETFLDVPLMQAYLNQDESWDAFLEKNASVFPLEHQHQLQSFIGSMPTSIRESVYCNDYLRLVARDFRLPSTSYEQSIRVVPFGPFDADVHVFVLGFCQGSVPRIHRDIGWLNDSLKQSLGLLTSRWMNVQEEVWIRYTLAHQGSVYLSRSHQGMNGRVLPSPFVDTLSMKEIDVMYTQDHVDYSMELGRIRKRIYEEKWTYYRYQHPYLPSLKKAFPKEETRFSYFPTPVRYPLPTPLKLSYSSVNEYFQCGFKYFVSRVLRVEPYDPDEFYMHLGTFAHDVFEHLKGDLSSFSSVFAERLVAQPKLTPKERILFRHLQPKLEEVARFNALHQQKMNHPSFIEEMKVSIDIDEHTLLKGVIDRTILLGDDQGDQYIALMDYKSGSESFDGTLMEYGWSLQLPIYALMIQHHPDLKNRELIGVFIQHILHKSMKRNVIEIGNEQFPVTYQLDGVLINETQKAAYLDQNLLTQSSPFILSTTLKSGEYLKENSHVGSAEYLASMQTIAQEKIIEASKHIRHYNYALNPRKIKNKSSCDYCPFHDICFRQAKDVTHVRTKKDEMVNDESN